MMKVLGQQQQQEERQIRVNLQVEEISGHHPQQLRGRNDQERTDPEYCDWCGRTPSNPSLGVVISNYVDEGSTTTCMGLYRDGLEYQIPGNFCNPIRIALNEACGCEPLPADTDHDRRRHRALATTEQHKEKRHNLEQ